MKRANDWPESYLSLRAEVAESIRKQDQLFVLVLTAFGVLATLVSADGLDPGAARALCVAVMLVAIIFQSKTIHYRDTVYYVSSYMRVMEKRGSVSPAWLSDLSLFKRRCGKLAGSWSIAERLGYRASRIGIAVKDLSFLIMSALAFAVLLLESPVPPSVVGLGVALLALSSLLTLCVLTDRSRRDRYEEVWRECLGEGGGHGSSQEGDGQAKRDVLADKS